MLCSFQKCDGYIEDIFGIIVVAKSLYELLLFKITILSLWVFTCLKSTEEILEQGVKDTRTTSLMLF